MKFKYDSNQDFQITAINSVVNLFNGQPPKKDLPFSPGNLGTIGNNLNLQQDRVFLNRDNIQYENKIPLSIKTDDFDFSIEMETGTGKTYTYFRTIYELNIKYGWTKFIIIVPSVAIKEGVLKTYRNTREHFDNIYSGLVANCYEYDSKRPNQVRTFGRDININIMIMTLHSFNKDTNVIKQKDLDGFESSPITYLQQTNPILILDEPQNMESELSIKSIKELNPMITLRYSGTHKNYYNLLYRLSPYESYQRGLVKQIEVESFQKKYDFNQPHIKVIDIGKDRNKNKPFFTKIECHIIKDGEIYTDIKTLRQGDKLERITRNNIYKGYELSNINTQINQIEFANLKAFSLGQDENNSKNDIQKLQIARTIKLHLDKQKEFNEKGLNIKVLSLFFIDRVNNYIDEGWIKIEFEKKFNEIKKSYDHFKNKDSKDIHSGYFAKKTSKNGNEIYKDELKNNQTDRDLEKQVYNLIMKDKERLLSFDEDVSFIFSHSTLREGWDNPNVFQITTLNETVSDIKKRQEIGRGLRLCVETNGDSFERVFDRKINKLSVLSNESYEEFVSKLQTEYENELFPSDEFIKPTDGSKKRKVIKVKKEVINSKEFKDLWKRISKKTRYKINFDSNMLVKKCVDQINTLSIDKITYRIDQYSIQMSEKKGVSGELVDYDPTRSVEYIGKLPNLVQELIKETNLTRKTICKILEGIENYLLEDFIDNPRDFIFKVSQSVNNQKKLLLIDGIEYQEQKGDSGEILYYEQSLFEDLKDVAESTILDLDTFEGISDIELKKQKTPYDSIIYESSNEIDFVKKFITDPRVKLFFKLPSKFKIPTPIGSYNPDWGYILEEKDMISGKIKKTMYFVGESKTSKDEMGLRGSEFHKIQYSKKHFDVIAKDSEDTQYKHLAHPSEI
tara:strand:+ start:2129 stop:4840 length:2712 start_codon:yes stop_codon:yes gene_type:complete